jgi:hypothetical protein
MLKKIENKKVGSIIHDEAECDCSKHSNYVKLENGLFLNCHITRKMNMLLRNAMSAL